MLYKFVMRIFSVSSISSHSGKRLICAHKIDSAAHTGFWLTCTHKIDSVVHTQPWGGGVGLVNFIIVTRPHSTSFDLPSHFNLGGWGGAREEKGRIYQPHPLLNFIIGTQPLLHFLRLAITLQPWGGVGLGKKKAGSTSHPRCLTSLYGHNRYSTSFDLPSHFNLGGWGGTREEKGRIYQPHPLLNFIIRTQPLLHFLRLTITLQPWGVGWG